MNFLFCGKFNTNILFAKYFLLKNIKVKNLVIASQENDIELMIIMNNRRGGKGCGDSVRLYCNKGREVEQL